LMSSLKLEIVKIKLIKLKEINTISDSKNFSNSI